jgi:hypothetical protein
MSVNAFARLVQLLPNPPLQIGNVLSVDGQIATVQLLGGNTVQVRGAATVGQSVFFRNGAIEGEAPSMTVINIEV